MNYEAVQTELFRRLTGHHLSATDAIRSLLALHHDNDEIHAQLVASLLCISVDNEEARGILDEILAHHEYLAQRLSQRLDLRVAAMDYATRHPELIDQPTVVDQQLFALSQRLAAVDELTGLFNRRFLDTYLEKELNRAQRHDEVFSIVFVDLDNFKQINDVHGHEAGDRVLTELGHEILGLLRKEDFAARYGGEEFLVVLPHTAIEGANRFAERLRERVGRISFDDVPSVTFSGGIATFPLHGTSVSELIGSADAALYRAKRTGKAHIRLAAPEKRSAPRHPADLRAVCFVEEQRVGEVRVRDISEVGVSLAASTMITPGQSVR
ncbi:MAG: GGDEF domain-containing protein, partial [Spirochaetota bacterium]